jgi:hypothetical protein
MRNREHPLPDGDVRRQDVIDASTTNPGSPAPSVCASTAAISSVKSTPVVGDRGT